ncbi:MAG TPA: GDSL-type esterase/lipase family protein [Bacteroidales bacterium]|nr:GDSL-type esterase/lipase family protein [Bacteroidales bacterium]
MNQFRSISIMLILMFSFVQEKGFSSNGNQDNKKNIVMFGNSITFQGKWEDILERTDVVNRGIPGYTTGQLIWTIKDVLRDYPGTKIWFLEGGINDIGLGVPVTRIFENYKITVDSLKRNHIIPVVQLTILKVAAIKENKKVNKLNKLIRKYCLKNQIDYIDLNAFLSKDGELKKEISTDGTHLKPNAYIPWGEAIKEVLDKYKL